MTGLRRLRAWASRGRRLLAVGAALLAAVALVAAAILAISGAFLAATAVAGLGLAALLAVAIGSLALGLRRVARLETALETHRLALSSVARDTDQTARSAKRIELSTRRALAAMLALDGTRSTGAEGPDPTTLAAMVVLGAHRELHFLGDADGFTRHLRAWEALDPGCLLGRIPDGGEGAYLDRRTAARADGIASLPTFVVDSDAGVDRAVSGDVADLVVAVWGERQHLVLLPPESRSRALAGHPDVTVTALGPAAVLVQRPPSRAAEH